MAVAQNNRQRAAIARKPELKIMRLQSLAQLAIGVRRGGIKSIGKDDRPRLNRLQQRFGERLRTMRQARHDNVRPKIGGAGKQRALPRSPQLRQKQNADSIDLATQNHRAVVRARESIFCIGMENPPRAKSIAALEARK